MMKMMMMMMMMMMMINCCMMDCLKFATFLCPTINGYKPAWWTGDSLCIVTGNSCVSCIGCGYSRSPRPDSEHRLAFSLQRP